MAIVGRANVGKSTLLNALVGQKVAIVSDKPHTTRHKLLGVLTNDDFQAALLDTPGFLRHGRDQLDSAMSRQLASALADADLVMLVAEARPPGDVELQLVKHIKTAGVPAVLVVNKIDQVTKNKLLPVIGRYADLHGFVHIVPVSGLARDGLDHLLGAVASALPAQEPIFPPDTLTDRSVRFLAGEIVREKVFELYADEIPYDVAIEIEDFEEREGKGPDYIRAVVYVDKPSQKRLLIGKNGGALKEVGVLARPEIEELVGRPVYLELWVKVNLKWRRKAGFIQRLL